MIHVTRDGPLAFLRLDRPEVRNALSREGWNVLADAAGELARSDARAVLLHSQAPLIFSAGADIAEFSDYAADAAAAADFRTTMRRAIEAVAALPMPVIAAIDGGCYGAAVALVLACDLRVGGGGAQFAVTPAKLGIGYPREDVARLAAQVGRGQAARMLYTCEIFDAADAEAIGLIELRSDEALPLARQFAERMAANAPEAVRLLKRTLRDSQDPALDAAFDASFASAEFAEGLAAFRERRRPAH